MSSSENNRTRYFVTIMWKARRALLLVLVVALMSLSARFAFAQSYQVIYNFSALSTSGGNPETGLSIDRSGNLYGAANEGQYAGGTIFRLSPRGSRWTFNLLYAFMDEAVPRTPPIMGSDGALYGTTAFGGTDGMGSFYRLQPRPTFCPTFSCTWIETPLYSFMGSPDDGYEPSGPLTFDSAGSVYVTTEAGGQDSSGAVVKLSSSAGQWSDDVLYSFLGGSDGQLPYYSGVVFDAGGNLYGTLRKVGLTEGVRFSSWCPEIHGRKMSCMDSQSWGMEMKARILEEVS